MGYMHIENLYKNQTILMFRRCWALEKVHGTSASVQYSAGSNHRLWLSPGGANHDAFVSLFDKDLAARIASLGHPDVVIHGEAHGGRLMGMRETYGDQLRFVAFDVRIGEAWLSVPDARQVVESLGLEMVPFVDISTDLEEIDRARDAPSELARRRGLGDDRPREGVVLRPPVEVTLNSGHRVVAKHKRESFSERETPQRIVDPAALAVLSEATAIAQEWVTPMRLVHVLDGIPRPIDASASRQVIDRMIADIRREAAGEIVESREAATAIGRRTALLLRDWIRAQAQSATPPRSPTKTQSDDS